MAQHHNVFLRDLEHRIILWEGRSEDENHKIGDVMLKNMVVLPVSLNLLMLPCPFSQKRTFFSLNLNYFNTTKFFSQIYDEYFENLREILETMNTQFYKNEQFQQTYRDFEQQKICYIPITYLLLKPMHRLLHYQLLLESKTIM